MAKAAPVVHDEHLRHEIQVHRVELELQNESLREAQAALEESRNRYLDLYEFAPVGYLTLGETSLISEANRMAATLLGVEREQLLGKRLEHFVAAADRDRWHRLSTGAPDERSRACELTMLRGNGERFEVLLDCRNTAPDAKRRTTAFVFTDISERKRMEQALARSEESFRRLAQISPAGIFRAEVSGAFTYLNQRCAEIAARPVEELLGQGWLRVMHPEDRERVLAEWRRDMSARQPKPIEWRVVRPDGSIRWVVSEAAAELDGRGKVIGYISCISDITDRKQGEAKRLADTRQQRDTLVREVHHRIKNNLQSVAGLLQRELGKYLELDPPLETAISQVHAIAVVHGLQGADPDEAIRLCDSVGSICKTVSDLSRRPVRFQIEHERTRFRPVRVESDEAVAVALILNELILNAVKHSPESGREPSVSLSADGVSAQLVIRNALVWAPDFDLDRGEGFGTGLRLVRSLLPNQGAQLRYGLDADGCMLTTLKLASPVVSAIVRKEADLP